MLQSPHILLTFDKVHNPLRLPRETTSERPKALRTPEFFALDNINNEAILRDFLQKWKVECRADGLVPMRFAIFV